MKQLKLAIVFLIPLACTRAGSSEKNNDAQSVKAPTSKTSAESDPAACVHCYEQSDLPRGLLVAYSQFQVVAGKATANPGPARMELLTSSKGKWRADVIEDADSNVFHKAMAWHGSKSGILTLGGTRAILKLWVPSKDSFTSSVVWQKDFGGKFSRMRDGEIADVFGKGPKSLVVATHDQGVVAILTESGGTWKTDEIDHKPDTFVHEIEIGDLNGDGIKEIYTTPSEPNKLESESQHGEVVSYVPAKSMQRKIVADLGARHAKEILVRDMDGDGRDELYVAVEAKIKGQGAALAIEEPVEIRRFVDGSAATERTVIATLDDRFCRFLTAGDVDGDKKKELVIAAFKSGVWLYRPSADPKQKWTATQIDANSGGFEHAALLTDLDGDGRDELYVADDSHGELHRYVWSKDSKMKKETLAKRPIANAELTWNLAPIDLSLLRK